MVVSPKPTVFPRFLIVAITSFVSIFSFLTYPEIPQAQAADSSFGAFFANCSDDSPEEDNWFQIKACLENGNLNEPYATLWNTVVKQPLYAFFDNHGSTAAAGIPADIQAKPFFYGGGAPANNVLDQAINVYLREGANVFERSDSEGMDGFQEIGHVLDKILTGNLNDTLCQLLDVPPGGPAQETDDAIVPYKNMALYGPNGDGDTPRCTREDILRPNDEPPYLVKQLAAAMLYMIADIGSRENFILPNLRRDVTANVRNVQQVMGQLKTYFAQTAPYNANNYIDLTGFYQNHFTDDSALGTENGPIYYLMQACQREFRATPKEQYFARIAECYRNEGNGSVRTQRQLSTQTREFVTDILIPATAAMANIPDGEKDLLREFMNSADYLDLADGYDPLATRRFDYPIAGYLTQTLSDAYLAAFGTGSFDSDQITTDFLATQTSARIFNTGYNDALQPALLRHLKAVNTKLIEKFTVYLDRPVPSTPPAPPEATAPANGNTAQQNVQTFQNSLGEVRIVQKQSRKNVLEQMNRYIDQTGLHEPLTGPNKRDAILGAWYLLATVDHNPEAPGIVGHATGDLELVIEDRDAQGLVLGTITDPFLARLMNACSPNYFSDTINKADLPKWKACLQYEGQTVDSSATNREHKVIMDSGVFAFRMQGNGQALNMARSTPAREAIQELIARIDACINNPVCLSLNERDESTRANNRAGLEDNGVDTGNALLNTILSLINVMLALIIKFFFWLTGMVMALFQAVLSYTGFTTSDFVVTMWKAVRDFVNLFFILALLGIAVANIVQYEINNYAIKTILPKLIVIVIAVNFSRLFVGIVVDAANVVEAGVYQIGGMGPHGAGTSTERCSQYGAAEVSAGGWRLTNIPEDIKQGSLLCRLATGLKFEEMQRYAVRNNPNQPGRQIDFFFANVALLLMVVMIFFGFLALAITFSIRIVILWALAITSPLYVVSKLSPLTQSIGGQWQSKFFKYATMHVGVAFFMTLAVLAADSIVPNLFSAALQTPGLIAGSQLGPSGFSSLADYLKLGFIIAMVYAGVFTAAKGDYAQGFIDKVAGFGSPSSVWNATKKTLGFGYGASQAVGNRLRDVKTHRLNPVGYALRGAGRLLAAPGNIVGGGKAIYGELKRGAEERKQRFDLQAGKVMSYGIPFGEETRDRIRARVLSEENKIVSERKEDLKLRFTVKQIEDKLEEAKKSGDGLRLKAATLALAEKGALHWRPEDREALRTAEARRTTQEQADNFIDNIEATNVSARDRRYQDMAGVVARSGNKTEIDRRLLKAWQDRDQAAVIGLLMSANQTGRIEDSTGTSGLSGHALALARLLQLRQAGLEIDEDTYRQMSRTIGKESIAAYGTQFRDKGAADGFTEQLAQVAIKHDNTFNSAASTIRKFAGMKFADIAKQASADELKKLTELMGQLGGTGAAHGHLLTETTDGAKLATSMAAMQRQIWGLNLVPEGDDGAAATMTQFLEAPSLAETFRMADNGQFLVGTSKIKFMQNFMAGLMRNANVNTQSEDQLNKVVDTLKNMVINDSQKQTMKTLLETIAKADPRFDPTSSSREQPLIDRMNDVRTKLSL